MNRGLRTWLELTRFPALFTTWSNILAAHFIVTSESPDWSLLGLLLGTSSALYLGGMVLNDCCDYQEDLLERPYRPLPSGRIGRQTAWALTTVLLAAGLFLAALTGYVQLIIALVLLLAIVAYDCWLKHYVIGTLAMGLCRYLNWLLGLSVLPLSAKEFLLPLPIMLYAMTLTFLGRSETGGDGQRAIDLSLLGLLGVVLAIGLLYLERALDKLWPLIPGISLILYAVRSLVRARSEATPQVIQKNMKLLLLGIVPLDAFMTFAAGPWWGGITVLLLLIPSYLLARVIYIT